MFNLETIIFLKFCSRSVCPGEALSMTLRNVVTVEKSVFHVKPVYEVEGLNASLLGFEGKT